jgi:hypothetical protein
LLFCHLLYGFRFVYNFCQCITFTVSLLSKRMFWVFRRFETSFFGVLFSRYSSKTNLNYKIFIGNKTNAISNISGNFTLYFE